MNTLSLNQLSRFILDNMNTFLFVLFVCSALSPVSSFYYQQKDKYDVFMPNVTPSKPNSYLCTPVKIDPQRSYYIVGFEPHASMNTVHHMILYGCSDPGLSKSVWNCGEMAVTEKEEETASPCAGGSTILYAWARDAPKLELPEGVAFKIGRNSGINYIVLQIHYGNVDRFKDGKTDTSGLFLHYTETPLPRAAGVLLLGTVGEIQKYSLESMETACQIKEDKILRPFAFRVHTHELGVRVAGYRVRTIRGVSYWTLIGERDPMLPQMFYPVENDIVIRKNDVVAAACKMDATNRNRTTEVGPTAEDEMCNFYMMYWVEDDTTLHQHYCFSDGPPNYYWSMILDNIPQKETLTYRKNREF